MTIEGWMVSAQDTLILIGLAGAVGFVIIGLPLALFLCWRAGR